MTDGLSFDGGLTCALECADLERSLAWYETTLGMTLLYKVDDLGWAELQSPVARVNVGLSEVETPSVRGGATLTFGVVDIESGRQALEAKGVAFDGEVVVYPGMVKLSTFYDPDGNKLMLYQDLVEASE